MLLASPNSISDVINELPPTGKKDKKGKTKIYEINGKKVNKERFDFVPKPKQNHPKSIGENKVFRQLNVSSNDTFLVLDKSTLMKTAKKNPEPNNSTQSSKKSKNRQGKISKKVSRYYKFIKCPCKFGKLAKLSGTFIAPYLLSMFVDNLMEGIF